MACMACHSLNVSPATSLSANSANTSSQHLLAMVDMLRLSSSSPSSEEGWVEARRQERNPGGSVPGILARMSGAIKAVVFSKAKC